MSQTDGHGPETWNFQSGAPCGVVNFLEVSSHTNVTQPLMATPWATLCVAAPCTLSHLILAMARRAATAAGVNPAVQPWALLSVWSWSNREASSQWTAACDRSLLCLSGTKVLVAVSLSDRYGQHAPDAQQPVARRRKQQTTYGDGTPPSTQLLTRRTGCQQRSLGYCTHPTRLSYRPTDPQRRH